MSERRDPPFQAQFAVGDPVRIRDSYPSGHVRTPFYIRGIEGEIADMVGSFPNPEMAALGGDGLPEQPLYRVRFQQRRVWAGYKGPAHDTIDIEIYEHWLEPT